MIKKIDNYGWPVDQIQQAMTALIRQQSWVCESISANIEQNVQRLTPEKQISSYSQLAGLSSTHIHANLTETGTVLPATAPALLLSDENGTQQQLLVIVRCTRKHAYLLAPDLKVSPILLSVLETWLTPKPTPTAIEDVLSQLPKDRLLKAQRLLAPKNSKYKLNVWSIQVVSLPWYLKLKQNGAIPIIVTTLVAYATQYALMLLAWWVIGYGALRGRFDSGLFWLWVLLLAALPILRMSVISNQGKFAIRLGVLLKQRLLSNALDQPPESIFSQGIGSTMGRIFESDRLHSLALNSGFMTLFAVFEYLVAGVIISLGSGGTYAVGLWGLWFAFSLYCAWILFQRRKKWTENRLNNTQQLMEKMQGHRTRLIQETPGLRHHGEDIDLTNYLNLSKHMDRAAIRLQAVIPRGWLIFGCLGLVPGLLTYSNTQTINLAIGLGGVLLAYQALQRLMQGITELISATIAFNIIQSHLSLTKQVPKTIPSEITDNSPDNEPLLKGIALNYAYHQASEPVLKQCQVSINKGDRILLVGASGSGKSTLAAILAGLKQPQSGVMTLGGLDLPTIGCQGWRLIVASTPQFHQNHVLANTFIFNLLMGKRWPPERKDVEEAEEICEELGLMQLIEQMPAGLSQTIGDTGWQLSHGERSRLYIARALLQGAELIILDESFAALDPENLQLAMECVERRASTLLVIAHP